MKKNVWRNVDLLTSYWQQWVQCTYRSDCADRGSSHIRFLFPLSRTSLVHFLFRQWRSKRSSFDWSLGHCRCFCRRPAGPSDKRWFDLPFSEYHNDSITLICPYQFNYLFVFYWPVSGGALHEKCETPQAFTSYHIVLFWTSDWLKSRLFRVKKNLIGWCKDDRKYPPIETQNSTNTSITSFIPPFAFVGAVFIIVRSCDEIKTSPRVVHGSMCLVHSSA